MPSNSHLAKKRRLEQAEQQQQVIQRLQQQRQRQQQNQQEYLERTQHPLPRPTQLTPLEGERLQEYQTQLALLDQQNIRRDQIKAAQKALKQRQEIIPAPTTTSSTLNRGAEGNGAEEDGEATPTALTHEEVWDDSALRRDWDEAVQEYEFYHSLAARQAKGENIDHILRQAEEENDHSEQRHRGEGSSRNVNQSERNGDQPNGGEENDRAENGEVMEQDGEDQDEDEEQLQAIANDLIDSLVDQIPDDDAGVDNDVPPQQILPTTATVSEQQLPQTHDSVLENMKMAYWWAGYYSGLHEGQRKQQEPKP